MWIVFIVLCIAIVGLLIVYLITGNDVAIIVMGVLIWTVVITGEVRCIYKMITCNWEPIGKSEIVYTAGVFTGAGAVIGWFDIEDK